MGLTQMCLNNEKSFLEPPVYDQTLLFLSDVKTMSKSPMLLLQRCTFKTK